MQLSSYQRVNRQKAPATVSQDKHLHLHLLLRPWQVGNDALDSRPSTSLSSNPKGPWRPRVSFFLRKTHQYLESSRTAFEQLTLQLLFPFDDFGRLSGCLLLQALTLKRIQAVSAGRQVHRLFFKPCENVQNFSA